MLGLKNISVPNRRDLSRTTQGRATFDVVGYYR
jgi:hypothetical protein